MRLFDPILPGHDRCSILRLLATALLLMAAGGCTQATQTQLPPQSVVPPATMLLVSLDDGSLIRQDVSVDADVCMKSASAPQTVCFRRGAPIHRDDQIIGYEMDRTEIELHGE